MTVIKLNNGAEVKASLRLPALKSLRGKDSNLYALANKVVVHGPEDATEIVKVAYAGYVACCEGKPDYTQEEFEKQLPESVPEIAKLVNQMIR